MQLSAQMNSPGILPEGSPSNPMKRLKNTSALIQNMAVARYITKDNRSYARRILRNLRGTLPFGFHPCGGMQAAALIFVYNDLNKYISQSV